MFRDNLTRIKATLHEYQKTFLQSSWVPFRMRNVSDTVVEKIKTYIFTFSNLFTNVPKLVFIVINLIFWTFYVGEAQILPVFIRTVGLGCSVLNLCPQDVRFQYRRSTGILVSVPWFSLLTSGKWRYFRLRHDRILPHPFQDEIKNTLLT
jgi:hypothetical protein